MAVNKKQIKAFVSGTHNLIDSELIPQDAASESIGWLTKDGRVELSYGRQAQGAEGTTGKNYGEHTGFKTNGDSVRFRKVDTVVQYYDGSAWQDTITGLTASDMVFTNYSSVAGNSVYVSSPDDGLFKIITANPGSYTDVNDDAVNFKGYMIIDKARSLLWGRKTDPTGLYGSYIDGQDGDVYTTVASEALAAVESGTLAFKAGGATRTCFAVQITDTSSGEVFSDNYDGTLTGDAGSTGTINYTTGEFTITGQTGAGTADYQWEDSNANGVTDYTFSATRLAGEGFSLRQDVGGDAIQLVLPYDGSYFSFKENSVYRLTLDLDDTNPTNEIVRTDIGVPSLRSAVGTGAGIVFMNTGDPTKPMVHILKRNVVGDNFDVEPLFPHFKFENYTYTDTLLVNWDDYVVIGCQEGTADNNRILLCNVRENTVSAFGYGIRTATQDNGLLYGGDPLSKTTYELFSGFDDMGTTIQNEWISAADHYGMPDALKRTKRFRIRGLIDPNQSIKVYVALDDGSYSWVGTILGSGDYVNYSSTFAIGTTFIGQDVVGGENSRDAYSFLMQLKIRLSKFRKRKIKLVAQGYGYCAIQSITDWDIWEYENKLPKSSRVKQNVSLDGATTDEASPAY